MATLATQLEVEAAIDRGQQDIPLPLVLNQREIARRAYDLYLARGRKDGHDVEDWLQAERELRLDVEC
jgi:hypothetical protein